MRLLRYVVCLWLVLPSALDVTQDIPSVELLKPLSSQKASDLSRRYPIQRAQWEYFAKPGRFGLFEFDVEDFEHTGKVTLTPFGTPIELVSHGLTHSREWRGMFTRWNAELVHEELSKSVPIEWNIVIQSVGADGILRFPDPNREITRRAIQSDTYTVLAESFERLNERLVYSLGGNFLQLPDRTLVFQTLGDRFDAVIVYEQDESKTITLGDAIVMPDGTVLGEDNPSPWRLEQLRRANAYDAFMERVKQEAGANDP